MRCLPFLSIAGLTGLLLVAGTCFVAVGIPARAENKDKSDSFNQELKPLLSRYCVSCHGETKPKAGLNLAALQGSEKLSVWKGVWERIKSRQMPPPGHPQPTVQERKRLTGWIEGVFAQQSLDGHPDPGPLRPRRLNVREYRNTLRDLAITKNATQPRKTSYVPRPDGRISMYQSVVPPPEHPCAFIPRNLPQETSDGGFDTISENLSIPPFLMEKYLRCTKLLLDDMFSLKGKDEHNRYQWVLREQVEKAQKGPWPRGVTAQQAVPVFLREFATRAFRRPVSLDEVERYVKLFDRARQRGDDYEAAIRLTLQAMLVSPRFILLWSEEKNEATTPVRPLNGHELATRLSYFLWSSLPDRDLVLAADQGRLQDDKVIEEQVRRMLTDRRITDGLLEGFLCQWLQRDKLERAAPDADRYPLYFQNNLAELMTGELLLFTDAILVEDRSILEFLDADWGFLCFALAQHYGIDNFPGKKPPSNALPEWYRVKFADKRRGGLLTMGKVLTGTSQAVRTSPVHRGKWVLETILGTPPPPPPPDVDNILKEEKVEGKKNRTVRQRLEQHRANPACYSCHQIIDPLGMAFETYDPVGKWREQDEDQPVDASGILTDGTKFKGMEELKALLMTRKDDFVRCFVEQMLTYALGRKLETYDAATVKRIAQAVKDDGYKFSRVVVEVAKSYPFRHRRVKEVE